MDSGMFKGLGDFLTVLVIALCLTLPLGIWKLVEIILWVCHHIQITTH